MVSALSRGRAARGTLTVMPMDLDRSLGEQLENRGHAILPGALAREELAKVAAAYDRVLATASFADRSRDGANVRVHGLLDESPEFDRILLCPSLLAAAGAVIGQPFKLSALLGRSVLPLAPAQPLHADFEADDEGWPMLGFILMIDDFRLDNGATRVVPGSHRRTPGPAHDTRPESPEPACGPAGSLLLYNGSVRHGHGANRTGRPRRSIQGSCIRRSACGWYDHAGRMRPDTLSRLKRLVPSLIPEVVASC